MKTTTRRTALSQEARSRIMKAIRARDTNPEKIVRRSLHSAGLRFRVHAVSLPGRPDIVLPKYRTAVFINGCFWHQHRGCDSATRPKVNRHYWLPKLRRTVARDERNVRELRSNGWRVYVVWECEISQTAISRLAEQIRSVLRTPAFQDKRRARRQVSS